MKVITLIPIKNESWILDYSLKNFSEFSDIIIVADQMSTDKSKEIYKKFPKVKVINNEELFHSNIARWKLLDEARKYGNNNLIICLDADEIVLPDSFKQIRTGKYMPGQAFEMPWIQLWQSPKKYRVDNNWNKLTKVCAFIDDGKLDYDRKFVINDHTARIPQTKIPIIRLESPLLHLEYVPFEKNQLKQIWYRCSELISGKRSARRINATYSVTLDSENVVTNKTPIDWLKNIDIPDSISSLQSSWHKEKIIEWFNQYGILFFEPLQIWHINDLREEFVKRIGREPVSKVYPKFIIKINNIKNKIINKLR